MAWTVSAKIEDELIEYLDELVIDGYADSRSSAIRFCIAFANNRMDLIEEEKRKQFFRQKICEERDIKD